MTSAWDRGASPRQGTTLYYDAMLPSPTGRPQDSLDAGCARSSTGISIPRPASPFWLDFAKKAGWDPRREIRDVRRPAALRRVPGRVAARRPGAALGAERARGQADLRLRDRRHDRHPEDPRRVARTSGSTTSCSAQTLPDEYFPKGSNWLMLGPSGPRRLRLAVEHLAQYPRRHLLLRRSRSALGHQADQEGLERAPAGLQGSRHRSGGDDPAGRATTSAACSRRRSCSNRSRSGSKTMGTTIRKMGITGIFSGGTEFTPQWNRFAHEELLDGAYMTPTYGNTLMGLAASAPSGPAQRLQDHLLRAAAARGRARSSTSTIRTRSSSTARPAA